MGSESTIELRLACFFCAFVGVGYLFPFSALTQCPDFWKFVFPDENVLFILTCVYMHVNIATLGLIVIFFQNFQPNYTQRIVGGFIGQFISMVGLPISYGLTNDSYSFFWWVIIMTALAATSTAWIDSCAISFSALYPLPVQESLQLGIGISSLIGAIYRIISKALVGSAESSEGTSLVMSTYLYFAAGGLSIVLCIFMFFRLKALNISTTYLGADTPVIDGDEVKSRRRASTPANFSSPVSSSIAVLDHPFLSSPTSPYSRSTSSSFDKSDDVDVIFNVQKNVLPTSFKDVEMISHVKTPPSKISSINNYSPVRSVDYGSVIPSETLPTLSTFSLISQIWRNELLVFFTYALTLSLYPPLVTVIPAYNSVFKRVGDWYPLILLLLFSVCDVWGRSVLTYRFSLTKDTIWKPVFLRTLLLPLLLSSASGFLFVNDVWSVLFVGVLGFSNGYVGSLCIIFVNECVSTEDKGRAGLITGFVLNAGLVAGSTIGLFIDRSYLHH